jgi:hypothetical protein
MSVPTARRLYLTPGELDLVRRRLDLPAPPGFDVDGGNGSVGRLVQLGVLTDDAVHPSVAAGLAAACAPQVGVHLAAAVGDQRVTAVLGVRGALGGSLVHMGTAAVEVAAWPAAWLAAELSRVVPPLACSGGAPRHLPLPALSEGAPEPAVAALRETVSGSLRATAVAQVVLGQVVWLATQQGWVAVEPAHTRAGVRWATLRPVTPEDLGSALAPLLAAGLA